MSFTNAQLAVQIANLISYWAAFNEEYSNWIGGTVSGGPNDDGEYPLTNWAGEETLLPCPALLSDNVTGYVATVGASASAAAASETAAGLSETEATAQAVIATAQAVLADADRISAEAAESGAVDAKVTAIAKAAAAVVSAAAALVSENAAAASETAAADSETAAAASATAAATFDPATFYTRTALNAGQLDTRYYTETEVDNLLADYTLTSGLSITNWNTAYGWGDHAGLYELIDATLVRSDDAAYNATEWDTAYGWGDHASTYLPLAGGVLTGVVNSDSNILVSDPSNPIIRAGDDSTYSHINFAGLYMSRPASYMSATHASSEMFIQANTTINFRDTAGVATLALNTVSKKAQFSGDIGVDGQTSGAITGLTGTYGSVQVAGVQGADGWEGLNIGGKLALMNQTDGSRGGLYDDLNSAWYIQGFTEGAVSLYYDAAAKFSTTSGGAAVTGDLTATGDITGATYGGFAITDNASYRPGGNELLVTNGSGYLYTGWINTFSGASTTDPIRIYCSQDSFLRYMTPDNFIDFLEDEVWSFGGDARFTTNLPAYFGIDGGYGQGPSTPHFGATIWAIGSNYVGGTSGTHSSSSSVYGLRWIRNAHTDYITDVGEGLYVFQNGVYLAGIGTAGIEIRGTSDIHKADHGNYLYHASASYDNDQNGQITFGTGAASGGTTGDIHFQYTA